MADDNLSKRYRSLLLLFLSLAVPAALFGQVLSPFVENRGQTDPSILFYSDNRWGRVCVREHDMVFQVSDSVNHEKIDNVYVTIAGGDFVRPRGEGAPLSYLNYFKGADSSKWLSDVPVFENLGAGGALIISSKNDGGGMIRRRGGALRAGSFGIDAADDRAAAFVKAVLSEAPAIPDGPARAESQALDWATYLGGSKEDRAFDVVIGADGAVLLTGSSESSDIPVPSGYDQSLNSSSYADIYVAKLSSDGSQLLWATFIGGDFEDRAYAIALDAAGNVVVGGKATQNAPTPNGYSTQPSGIYVAKLSSSGSSLLWGTFITAGCCCALALDSEGSVITASETDNNDAPCPNGYDDTYNGGSSDLYLAKLSSSGHELLWGTYIGGAGDDCLDDTYLGAWIGLALAADGSIAVGTSTNSSGMPVPNGYDTSSNGLWDIWVGKLSGDGTTLSWGTYLGGSRDDKFGGLAADPSGDIVLVGATRSFDIPALNGCQGAHNPAAGYDGYMAKLASNGSSLIWATYLGGSEDDSLFSLKLDAHGNALFGGETHSPDIPVTAGCYDPSYNTNTDIYFGVLSSNGGSLLEASYVGGTHGEGTRSVAFDGDKGFYIAGWTCSDDIPVLNAYDPGLNNATCGNYGTYDIYAARFSISSITGCSLSCSASVPAVSAPDADVKFSSSAVIDPPGCTALSYDWDFGDGSEHSTLPEATHRYTAEATYTWVLKVSGAGAAECRKSGKITVTASQCLITCEASGPATGAVNIPVVFTASAELTGCSAQAQYSWDFGDGGSSTSQNPSHTYNKAGVYNWTMTCSAEGIPCEKSGVTAISSDRPCVAAGYLLLCADSVTQEGSTYTLSGNVNANEILYFAGDVTFVKLTSTSGNLSTDADIYVPNVHGRNENIITGPFKTFLVDGNELSFTPSYAPVMYALQLAGLPLAIGGTGMVLESGGVKVSPFIDLGSGQLTIAKVQAEILIVPGGEKTLLSMEVVAAGTCPSITVASISVTYDPATDTIEGSVSAGFPFLDTPSISATITFVSGCFDGFTLTVGLPAGIPLGTTGLEIDGFTMEVGSICDPPDLYIFLGGDLAIAGVPSEVLVLQHLGLGYQVPFTLEIDGGTLAFLGYPLGSSGGTITVYPPYVSAYGDTNIAGIYTTHVSMTLDISNLLISGSAYGSLQIPDWNCGCCNIACYSGCFCKSVRWAVRRALGGLPFTFMGAGMDVSIGQVEAGSWGGDMRGMLTVANQNIAADISFLNGDINLSVGTNYDNLFEVWQKEERFLQIGCEKTLTLPQSETRVIFSASSETSVPDIYLVTPTGERLTKDNYSAYQGAAYSESAADATSAFEITPAAQGDWTFGETNIDSNDVGLFALGVHPLPTVTFESVQPQVLGYDVNVKVLPASQETKVNLYYTASPNFGEGMLILKDMVSADGNYPAVWNTLDVPNGDYMIFAKADDGKNPPEAVYYTGQVTVDRDKISPPSLLSGAMLQDGAHLSWVPSGSPEIAGYDVLYTDEPETLGYRYKWHSVKSDGTVVSGLDPAKTYRFTVTAFDNNGDFSLGSNSITLAFVPPPVIMSMKKLGSPFRIIVSGSNLRQEIKVYINGELWANTKWKSSASMKIKGGKALKAVVPKGVDTVFRFVNIDGGEASITWHY